MFRVLVSALRTLFGFCPESLAWCEFWCVKEIRKCCCAQDEEREVDKNVLGLNKYALAKEDVLMI